MSDKFQVRLPEALHAEAKAAAAVEFMPLTSYVARAVRAYLDSQKPKTVTEDKPKPLSARERAALERKEKERREVAANNAWMARFQKPAEPEVDLSVWYEDDEDDEDYVRPSGLIQDDPEAMRKFKEDMESWDIDD